MLHSSDDGSKTGTTTMIEDGGLARLMARFPHAGRIEWIGLRPVRAQPMQAVQRALAITDRGLEGDRSAQRAGHRRQVTLIQSEHLAAVAALACRESVTPALLRRNVVVSGVNLLALKDRRFRLGEAVLEFTGLCHPCSRMETALGPGGYNAMRGHGGITARVLEGGLLFVGAPLEVLAPA
jgi:MOSC domain-containing protein YiiM